MKTQRINTFFWIPILLQNGNIKGHSLWFKLITTSNYKDVQYTRTHTGVCGVKCAVNTGQAWWKQELKSIDCDQLQLLLLSLSQRVQTHRYYRAGCREGRGCCGNGRLHLMSEDDEGDSFLWIWGDAAHRQKMEYVCESWTLNTILLSNRNPSVI